MHRAHARTLAVAAAALAASLGLGACGGPQPADHAARPLPGPPVPDNRPDAAPLLSKVIDRVNQAGSVHSRVQGDLGIIGDLTGDGSVSYHEQRADVSLTGQTRMRNGSTQPVQVTATGDDGYLKTPMLRPAPGKPWVRVTPGGADFASRLFAPALQQLREASDPRTAFSGIEHSAKIQSSAPDQVDGQPTTRYDVRVVTARAAEQTQDPQQRAQLSRTAKKTPEQDYQLWVDGSGLPVRFSATKNVAQAGQVALTSHYRDWGAPATVQPPPPEQVGVFDNPAQAQPTG